MPNVRRFCHATIKCLSNSTCNDSGHMIVCHWYLCRCHTRCSGITYSGLRPSKRIHSIAWTCYDNRGVLPHSKVYLPFATQLSIDCHCVHCLSIIVLFTERCLFIAPAKIGRVSTNNNESDSSFDIFTRNLCASILPSIPETARNSTPLPLRSL